MLAIQHTAILKRGVLLRTFQNLAMEMINVRNMAVTLNTVAGLKIVRCPKEMLVPVTIVPLTVDFMESVCLVLVLTPNASIMDVTRRRVAPRPLWIATTRTNAPSTAVTPKQAVLTSPSPVMMPINVQRIPAIPRKDVIMNISIVMITMLAHMILATQQLDALSCPFIAVMKMLVPRIHATRWLDANIHP